MKYNIIKLCTKQHNVLDNSSTIVPAGICGPPHHSTHHSGLSLPCPGIEAAWDNSQAISFILCWYLPASTTSCLDQICLISLQLQLHTKLFFWINELLSQGGVIGLCQSKSLWQSGGNKDHGSKRLLRIQGLRSFNLGPFQWYNTCK